MPDGNKFERMISTAEFYGEITSEGFDLEESPIRKFLTDFDPELFVDTVSDSEHFVVVNSSDGAISHVREKGGAEKGDNSASSKFFALHTDGKYLKKVPEIVILHCVNAGINSIPTVFVDTQDIIKALEERQKLEEAEDYDLIFRNKNGVDFIRPLIEIDPVTNDRVMNIAVGSPQCKLQPSQNRRSEREARNFYTSLEEIVEEDVPKIEHIWETGETIVFDNIRLIHGRGLKSHESSDASDQRRHLYRIWLSRPDNGHINP